MMSLPALASVLLFMSFFIAIFAILGLHLFIGDYYARCRLSITPVNATFWPIDYNQEKACSQEDGNYFCDAGTYCGHLRDYDIEIAFDNIDTNL